MILTAAIIYFIIMFLLKAITVKEIKELFSKNI
jgi:hypothetical protein